MTLSPKPINPAVVVLSQLVRDFKSLGHPADEALHLAESLLRMMADSGPKFLALAKLAAEAAKPDQAP